MSPNSRKAKRQQQIRIFNAFIEFCAIFARSPKLQPISNFLLRRLADLTFSLRKGQRQNDLTGLAKEWQRRRPRLSPPDGIRQTFLSRCDAYERTIPHSHRPCTS